MKEKTIEFKTALLAKEKGYDQNPYNTKEAYLPRYTDGSSIYLNSALFSPENNIATAPTKTELKDWLWDTHKIWVEVTLWGDGIGFQCMIKYEDGKEDDGSTIIKAADPVENFMSKFCAYKTLEIGIFEALKLI